MDALDPLLDAAPCGFVSFLDDGRVAHINATLLDLLGYERDELLGRHVEVLFTVGTRVFYQTHLFPLARLHGRADEIFLMLRSKAGAEIGVIANVVRHERDGASAYDVVLMRVQRRQKFEEELLRARQAADQARAKVESQKKELEQANATLEARARELAEQHERLEEQAAELEATSEELMVTNDELLTRTEEADRLRAMADAANRAKSDFLAVMSHELRTPLNAISGYVQILGMGIHGPLTAEQHDVLDRIDRSQIHLLRLINEVLNLSRLESGVVEYDITDVPLADVFSDITPLIEPQLAGKRLEFESQVAPDLTARADREKLEQILLNLLSNAIKFTPDGGRISLVGVSRDDAPDSLFVRVRDSGIGIPEDKLAAVFEPFIQVDATRTGASQGTGLGLAISRDLARGLDGDLEVESTPGQGSTFTLTLPRA